MSKATLEKLPQSEGADYFIVLDPKEGIVHHAYTADLGRSFGHEHIKDAQLDGVASAARWVVRPLFTAEPDLLKDRDEAEEFADKILDLVLGTDRHEWTSHYGREDALAEVEDKMAARAPAANTVSVKKVDANNYCRILAALGMEEEGDPVVEVQNLLTAANAPEPNVSVTEMMGLVQDYFVTGTDEARAVIETKLRALLTAVSTPSAQADALGTFPTMTDELASIWGLMCFQCISFAQALRAGGYSIKKRAEDEQAAVLHWMLGHYFHSGPDGWRAAASADMERMRETSIKKGGAA